MTSKKRKIERISTDIAEKITTAQVVVSLASALRQLVDNSIDAGATIIDIRAKNNGFDSIEVQDNGSGIEMKNFDALCKSHSTSKLTDYSDFDQLSTLGFRGEALNALCACSSITIFTRSSDSHLGSRLKFDHHGEIVEKSMSAREIGTTIIVENLFETLPVRRKELERTAKKDFQKMLATCQSFAIMKPEIRFLCTNLIGGKKVNLICTNGGNSTVKDVVANLFGVVGKVEKAPMVEIKCTKPSEEFRTIHNVPMNEEHIFDFIQFSGFMSSCESGNGRSTSDRQFVYINNRPVDYSRVCSVANEVYRQFNKAQYPMLVMFIRVPGDKIDVNVTPDKKTVMFEKEKHLLAMVRATIFATCHSIQGAHSNVKSSVEDRRNCSFYSSQSSSANSTIDESNLDDSSIYPNDSLPNIEDLIGKTNRIFQPRPKKVCISKPKPVVVEQKLEEFSFTFTPYERKEPEPEHKIHKLTPPLLRNISRGFDNTSMRDDSMMERVEREMDDTQEEEEELEDVGSQEVEIVGMIRRRNEEEDEGEEEYVRPQQNIQVSISSLRERLSKCQISKQSIEASVSTDNLLSQLTTPIDPNLNEEAEDQLSRALKKDDFQKIRVIGQFNKGFIICQLRSHLFIVDQHASDEKYNFEKLQRKAKLTKQPLFNPSPVNMGAVQEMVIRENLHIFQANGFDFDFRERNGCIKAYLIARPEILSQHLTDADLDELVSMVSEYPNQMYRPAKIRKIFASRACRKSIMIGRSLGRKEMKRVVRNLASLEQPWNCPHGRPTIRHLARLE